MSKLEIRALFIIILFLSCFLPQHSPSVLTKERMYVLQLYLFGVLQRLHDRCDHQVHQHKLSHNHETDEVQRRDPGKVPHTAVLIRMTFS